MAYVDKTLVCTDCGSEFVFTAGEQEFYDTKGFTNKPGRCPECRAARKRQRSSRGSRGYGPRQVYDVTCADCGAACQVPFQPRGDRPVYCSDCFEKHRSSRY